MKKVPIVKSSVIVILMITACMLIAGCTDEMANSPYTVDHEIQKSNTLFFLDLTVTGPPSDLVVTLKRGDWEYKQFISEDEMIASGKGEKLFPLIKESTSGIYEVIIRESDSSHDEGKIVHRSKIKFQGADLEIVGVYVTGGWVGVTKVRVHNSGDLPIHVKYFAAYDAKGERRSNQELDVGPGEYAETVLLYEKNRGGTIRVSAFDPKDQVIAKFEGVIA